MNFVNHSMLNKFMNGLYNFSNFSSKRWLLQFYPGNRDNIICRKDGTLRHSEPSAGEASLFCLLSFILIYYFVMVAMVWFAVFTYIWYLQTSGRSMYYIFY